MHCAGGATGAETGEAFAAFDTHETADSAEQLDNMADLTIANTTSVSFRVNLHRACLQKTGPYDFLA